MSITVKIKGTNETAELSMIDPESGVDWITEFMSDTLEKIKGEIYFDEEKEEFYAETQGDLDWWVKVIDGHKAVYDRMRELKQDGHDDLVFAATQDAACDLENWPDVVNQNLDNALAKL